MVSLELSYCNLENSTLKRSTTYRIHNAHASCMRNEAGVIQTYHPDDCLAQAQSCAIMDLSELNRFGLRGNASAQLLDSEGLVFPGTPNQATVAENGVTVARLGATECWVLDNPLKAAKGMSTLATKIAAQSDCYSLYCQQSHAWFALTGRFLSQLMAKLCGVDLREGAFPEGSVAQTSVARVNAIVIHHSLRGVPVFYLLSDSSSAEYFWSALLDAMQEFKGKPIGLGVFGES